jgi:hypothetical protein
MAKPNCGYTVRGHFLDRQQFVGLPWFNFRDYTLTVFNSKPQAECTYPQIGIAIRGKSASQANARFWFTRGSEMSTEKSKMENAKC